MDDLEGLGCLLGAIRAPGWAIVWLIDRIAPVGSHHTRAKRAAVYAASGLAVFIPLLFLLALLWGLTGPGWASNTPDVVGSVVQVLITLGAMALPLYVERRLIRIDPRDWWLGVVVAWPWLASLVGAIASIPSSGWDAGVFVGGLAFAFAAVCAAGPLLIARFVASNAGAQLQLTTVRVTRNRRVSGNEWLVFAGGCLLAGIIAVIALALMAYFGTRR